MKQSLSYLTAIIVLATAAFVGGGARAQTTANGSYYATPSWDQTLPANTRFIVLANFNNDAVLDRETGLVWERAPSATLFAGGPPLGTFGGLYAFEHCATLVLGNRKGWRLPSTYELFSLVDDSVAGNPKLPAGSPFTLPPSIDPDFQDISFWASNPYYSVPDTTRIRRVVDFFHGSEGAAGWSLPRYAWCVRGGSDSNLE